MSSRRIPNLLSLRNASLARTASAAVVCLVCAESIAAGITTRSCAAGIVQALIAAGVFQLMVPALLSAILACVVLCAFIASEQSPRWPAVGLASGVYIAFSALLFGLAIPVIPMIVFICAGLVLAASAALTARLLPWGLVVIAGCMEILACFAIAWWAASLAHGTACGPAI